MSRWAEKIESHAINEALKQTIEWASTEFEDTDGSHQAEQ